VTPEAFIVTLTRRWWWSPRPPWRYCASGGRSWGLLEHPGCFNLAWALSGIAHNSTNIGRYALTTGWVMVDAEDIHISGYSLADHAMALNLKEFDALLQHNRRVIAAHQFSKGMDAAKLMTLIAERRRARA
jgi:hypothetical protein